MGCCLSMVCCGIALVPLAERFRRMVHRALQPWCADDLGKVGTASDNATMLPAYKGKGTLFVCRTMRKLLTASWHTCLS